VFGKSLQQNMIFMVGSKLILQKLSFCVSGFPISAFNATGILGLFAFLSMRGLKFLEIGVTADILQTSLPTLLHTMIINYGCDVDLHLDFFLKGTENQVTTQYLLSLPEMHESIKTLGIRFLADYDESNHMFFLEDFIPFNIRLNAQEGQVLFKKLTTFKVQFEKPTHKAFLTFGWLRMIWPHLKHISIIVGRPETYDSERSIVWNLFKDKWKGRRSTSRPHSCFNSQC
jgi:hypothetical protein